MILLATCALCDDTLDGHKKGFKIYSFVLWMKLMLILFSVVSVLISLISDTESIDSNEII